MRKLFFIMLALLMPAMMNAQRFTDKLDRGLVAQKASTGVFLSWRILGEEYYNVKFNVYRNGVKINETPLEVSNYTDKSGSTGNTYSIAPVVNGKEQARSKEVKPWSSSYTEIKLTHEGIASTLVPNDACCADVDGDGELEILMKFDNADEMGQSYPKAGPVINGKATGEYSIFEVFKLDGTRLWWVNCGPNMGDFQNNEQNIVGYDWNQDGKAEVLMRLEEGSTIHYANGSTYTIGANGQNGGSWTNYRGATGGGTNWFMCVGKEFLVYCNGQTGEVFDIIDYPLARLEPGETDLNAAWGDGYGHRASKFFFGAPYLDGRNPSIFLARGIYTQIKMCAFDVNKATNKLVKRWDWRQTNGGYWMWQGYHNFGVADVDWDGRDEIVYGSMVIDDNGKGLSTTGLGHGDAQHCGNFNPYTHGQEIYACNEDQPGNNYRDATTSTIYHRFEAGNDDGRAMMDNFSDNWPGSIGCSAREGAISSVTYAAVSNMGTTGINTNFRIFWDGDLCSETFNYLNGKNTEGCVAKYGSWSPIYTCAGSMTNNDTKGTPCYQGDILGDWREEIIMRTANNNVRIYSTPTSTTYRIASLWSDHQYRNAMVWQMCGYNQPPHVSYFVGKMEDITVAPPPLTMTGREEVKNGGSIGSSLNGKHAIVCETGNSAVSIDEGAAPDVMTFNVPSWVQGTAGTNYTAKNATIKYEYYTCNVTGAGFTGSTRLVKQGDGILNLPKVAFTHTGNTDIWAGTVNFDGTMKQSAFWLNRFAELNSNGGEFRSIKADYASVIRPGGKDVKGTIITDSLMLGFGSRIVVDLYSDDITADQIKTKYLNIEKKTGIWVSAGPKYAKPVIEVVGHLKDGESMMATGKYVIGELSTEEGALVGSLDDIIVEGITTQKKKLYAEDGKIILEILGFRDPTNVTWTGAQSRTWDFATTENFSMTEGETVSPTLFVANDNVLFDDNATNKTVTVTGTLSPASMTFNNTSTYTVSGSGVITGGAKFTKEGTGAVTMSGKHTYTGGNYLKGGTVRVNSLSYDETHNTGSLGGVTTDPAKFTMENGAVLQSTAAVTQGSPMKMIGTEGGVINNSADFVMNAAFSGTKLTKMGTGWLKSGKASSLATLEVQAGVVDANAKLASKIIAAGSADLRGTAFLNTPIEVAKDAKAVLTTINRSTTNLALTGEGQITVWCATEKGSNYYATRTPIQFTTTNFKGTLVAQAVYAADGRFTFDKALAGTGWTLNIPSGIIVQNSGKSSTIGALTGQGTLGGGCAFSNGTSVGANTWKVGSERDFIFEGVFTSGDVFNKVGSGTMTVKGIWNNTSAVKVNAGTLKVQSGCLGTGALTVDAGARLIGTSATTGTARIIKNSSVMVNGTLMPGLTETATTGTMVFNNQNVTISTTGKLHISAWQSYSPGTTTKFSGPYIKSINRLTVNGVIEIGIVGTTWTNPAIGPQVGDKICLWQGVQTFQGTPKVVCSPFNGKICLFDTSDLANGFLTITGTKLLGDVNGDGKVTFVDANIVLNKVLGRSIPAIDEVAADMNQDGVIDKLDAELIVKAYLGIQ